MLTERALKMDSGQGLHLLVNVSKILDFLEYFFTNKSASLLNQFYKLQSLNQLPKLYNCALFLVFSPIVPIVYP